MKQSRNWHHLTTDEIGRMFRTDCATGLHEADAKRRLRHGKNTVWEVKGASAGKYAARSFMDLTSVLLVICALIAAVFGGGTETFLILIMLVASRGARIAAYILAQRVFEKNAASALPRARVVRDGNVRSIPADCIVAGDVIILDSGDTVPCDIRLTAADSFLVSEGSVTDNDGIIQKNCDPIPAGHDADVPVSMRTNMLYATSVVISGFGIGVAVATGRDTLVSAREGAVELSDGEDIPLLAKLNDRCRLCSLCLVAAAFLITVAGIAFGKNALFQVFLPSVAMAAASMSEFLGAAGAVAWAAALRPKKTENGETDIFKSAAAAEKAANADAVVLRSVSVLKSGKNSFHSYFADGKMTLIGTKDAKIPSRLLALLCYATGTSPGGSIASGGFATRVRQTSVMPYSVIRSLWEENGDAALDPGYSPVQHMSAGEEGTDGMDCVLLSDGKDFYFDAVGGVKKILSCCTEQRVNGEVRTLSEADRKTVLSYAENLKKRGVMLAASATRLSHYNSLRRLSVLQTNMCFEGFVAVSQRVEDEVSEMLSEIRSDGGRVIIFSDGSEEERFFAEAEGILKTGDLYLDAKDSAASVNIPLEAGSLSMICTPDGAEGIRERLKFLTAFSDRELSCAYIGYGVEDMWCMQKADASFAVPAPSKSAGGIPQALRTAAHGIVDTPDGGFTGAVRMIKRCRTAISNIGAMIKYLIVSQIARVIILLVSAVGGLPLLSASQLVFWGLILDFTVAIADAFVPDRKTEGNRASGRIQDMLLPAIYGTLFAMLSVASPFIGRLILKSAGMESTLTDGGIITLIFVSCILAMPFIGAEFAGGGLFGRASVYGKVYIAPFAAALAASAVTLFTPLATQASGAEFPGWIMIACSLVPALCAVVVMSVVRAFSSKNIKK